MNRELSRAISSYMKTNKYTRLSQTPTIIS